MTLGGAAARSAGGKKWNTNEYTWEYYRSAVRKDGWKMHVSYICGNNYLRRNSDIPMSCLLHLP